MLLHWLQQTGHRPIALMGGGTSKIGDPSGRDTTRQLLTADDIAESEWGEEQQRSEGSVDRSGLDLAARERLLSAIDRLRSDVDRLASVLVTHHLEDLPSSTTHAMLLRDGEVTASGPVAQTLTSDEISACFDHPVSVRRHEGRWSATAA